MTDTDTTPLRTLLVDDEPLAIERMTALCSGMSDIQIVGTASNGKAALKLVESMQPDLILLDIAMPELDGIGVVRALAGRIEAPPAIIFVTAFDNFAVQAFDTPAADYLLKPVAKDRLQRAIDRAKSALLVPREERPDPSDFITELWIPHRSELIRIRTTSIGKIEAERDYMRLFVGSQSYLLHQTITALEAQLDPALFIRVHRSTIVRKDRIERLGHDGAGTWHVEMTGGDSVRIGRTYLRRAKELAGR
jgi:two-component system, LytTR family, response regulator AlgR